MDPSDDPTPQPPHPSQDQDFQGLLPIMDVVQEHHELQGLQHLEDRINEVATASLNSHIDNTLTQSLQNFLTAEEHRTLGDVANGAIDSGEQHQVVQNAANLLKRARDHNASEDEIQPLQKQQRVIPGVQNSREQELEDELARISAEAGSPFMHHSQRVITRLQGTPEQELEQTLAKISSDVGLSIMLQSQPLQAVLPQPVVQQPPAVLDHNASLTLQGAVKHFYDTAYQYFEMATPAPSVMSSAPLCNVDNIPTSGESDITTARRSVIEKLLRAEMEKGQNIGDNRFVENFAKVTLQQIKYKFLCPCCLTLFCAPKHFVNHLIKNEGSFRCLYRCGASLKTLDNLRNHMKRLHGCQEDASQIGPGLFQCTEPGCQNRFSSRRGLLMHGRRMHDSSRGPCTVCKIVFETKAERDAHSLSAHGIKAGELLQFPCDVDGCNVRCRTESGLAQHKLRMHSNAGTSNGQ